MGVVLRRGEKRHETRRPIVLTPRSIKLGDSAIALIVQYDFDLFCCAFLKWPKWKRPKKLTHKLRLVAQKLEFFPLVNRSNSKKLETKRSSPKSPCAIHDTRCERCVEIFTHTTQPIQMQRFQWQSSFLWSVLLMHTFNSLHGACVRVITGAVSMRRRPFHKCIFRMQEENEIDPKKIVYTNHYYFKYVCTAVRLPLQFGIPSIHFIIGMLSECKFEHMRENACI